MGRYGSPPWECVKNKLSSETFHLSQRGEYNTLCGRNRETWIIWREANLRNDIDNAYLCCRCKRGLLI